MSWSLLEKPTIQLVTRELAREFMNMDSAPSDRPLSKRRLEVYKKLFQEGKFRPCTWARGYCKETGGIYRVNGKHTSTLLATMEDEIPEFYVTIESYDCPTLEDVSRLYSTFDSKMQSRTVWDINISFGGSVPELDGVPHKLLNTCASGMSYHKWLDGYCDIQPTERAELLLEYSEFVLFMQRLVRVKHGAKQEAKHLLRQPIIGAIFGTWLKDEKEALEFWEAVRDETGENPELPDRRVGRLLLTYSAGGKRVTGGVHRSECRACYVKCITGWNAWRKGKDTELRYFPDKEIPAIA